MNTHRRRKVLFVSLNLRPPLVSEDSRAPHTKPLKAQGPDFTSALLQQKCLLPCTWREKSVRAMSNHNERFTFLLGVRVVSLSFSHFSLCHCTAGVFFRRLILCYEGNKTKHRMRVRALLSPPKYTFLKTIENFHVSSLFCF